MIRMIIVAVVLGAIGWYLWWERTEKSRKRQTFFAIYNAALAKSKNKNILSGVSVSILDIIDETDIPPTAMHILLKELEYKQYLKMSSNTVKLTPEGVAYFRYNYLSESMKDA